MVPGRTWKRKLSRGPQIRPNHILRPGRGDTDWLGAGQGWSGESSVDGVSRELRLIAQAAGTEEAVIGFEEPGFFFLFFFN